MGRCRETLAYMAGDAAALPCKVVEFGLRGTGYVGLGLEITGRSIKTGSWKAADAVADYANAAGFTAEDLILGLGASPAAR